MKKFLFLFVVFALVLGAGCKKKVAVVEVPSPPPPPVIKQTEQEFVKGLISKASQLEPGKTLKVQIDKGKIISDESELTVSLFPLEFVSPAEKPYVMKYLFPSVVWRLSDSQLSIVTLPNYLDCTKPGEKIWILKESSDPKKPFKHIPTLLVYIDKGKIVLDQNGDEMPLRENWGK